MSSDIPYHTSSHVCHAESQRQRGSHTFGTSSFALRVLVGSAVRSFGGKRKTWIKLSDSYKFWKLHVFYSHRPWYVEGPCLKSLLIHRAGGICVEYLQWSWAGRRIHVRSFITYMLKMYAQCSLDAKVVIIITLDANSMLEGYDVHRVIIIPWYLYTHLPQNYFSLMAVIGVSWPRGLVHRTQIQVLSECGFESRPGWSRRLCPWARHLTIIASSFGWDVKL